MDHTITGAASGETVMLMAPKDSQSQAKGQKSNHLLFKLGYSTVYLDWRNPVFFYGFSAKS